jgi:pimeloyl-ACP methyl ester carboxylesterase
VTEHLVELPTGIRLCYRDEGEGEPLLLVAGLGQDLTAWPDPLVQGLVDRGFRVIRHDNRDVGRSSRVDAPPPATWRQLLVRPRPDAYTLQDMADDAVALLDHLAIDRAHLVGMSMGGMIAQTVAAARPDRVQSLISIFSTTGDTRVGQAAWSTKLRLVKPPARTREGFVRRHLELTAHLAGRGYPLDESVETAYAQGVWDRSASPGAGAPVARQIQAIQASGDRTDRVRRITTPTLVVHGDRDLIVHPSGGRATADAVPGARHVSVPGMGHHLAPGLLDRLTDLITDHTREAVTP